MTAVGMATQPALTASHTTEEKKEREIETEREGERGGGAEDKLTKLQSTEVNNDNDR